MKAHRVWLAVSFFAFVAPLHAQATWWVDDDAAPGGDGSQVAPFREIQQGIDAAASGDTVRVLAGDYSAIDYVGKTLVVESTDGASNTWIWGGPSCSGVRLSGSNSVLDGFGVGDGWGTSIAAETYGGGILIDGCDAAVVRDCVVQTNFATKGAGIAAWLSTGTVLDTRIQDNGGGMDPNWYEPDHEGGGVYGGPGLRLIRCQLLRNGAYLGAGAAGVTLEDCEVLENFGNQAAGLYRCSATRTTIRACRADAAAGGALQCMLQDCDVLNNVADENGGGAMESTLRGCTLRGNRANYVLGPVFGGGAKDCALEDCLVESNGAPLGSTYGGGAAGGTALRTIFRGNVAHYGSGVHGVSLDRCVVTGNLGEGASRSTLVNSVVWHNYLAGLTRGCVATYCAVEGGFPGTGNFASDPMLWNLDGGDYRHQPGSPCIDAGDPLQTDPDGSRVDIGPFPWAPFDCLPLAPYCSAKTTGACQPTLSAVGSCSLSNPSGFKLVGTKIAAHRLALVVYGLGGSGASAFGLPSPLCVLPPRQRTQIFDSGGSTSCSGSFTFDFDAWRAANPLALGMPFSAGDVLYAQGWYRNADSHAAWTSALRFVACP